MFRPAEYSVVDDTAGINSRPATNDRYIGSAFEQQTVYGTRMVDPNDDRVTFEAGIHSESPQAFSHTLPADNDGVGTSSVYGGLTFSGVSYGPVADTGPDNGRPRVSFPLSHESDIAYANRTNDMAGGTIMDEMDLLVRPFEFTVPEKSIQQPYRFSMQPAEIQMPRPWDTIAGAWPWTGEKVALQRPAAASPFVFLQPLENAIPSPTGTNNADGQGHMNVTPYPMTFRLPPEPWDTRDDGTYVDSGA